MEFNNNLSIKIPQWDEYITNMYFPKAECFTFCIFSLITFELGHTYVRLTCSTSSTLIPTETSASVTIYSVDAGTTTLTGVAGAFVGIWNENKYCGDVLVSFLEYCVLRWQSLGRITEYFGEDIFSCYTNGPQRELSVVVLVKSKVK